MRKSSLLQMERDTSTVTWLAWKSGLFSQFIHLTADHISGELYWEMKERSALSGGLISHYPEPAQACVFVLPLPPQVQKGSNPEIFRIKKGLCVFFFLSLAIPGCQTGRGRKGGCRVSTTISRRGKDAWHSESSGWDSLISPRALSVLEDHCF